MSEIVLASELKLKLAAMPKVATKKTGFTKLDEATDGFRGGQLIVLSGPTGGGKTAISRTLTKLFIDNGHKVCWFSFEESYTELFDKMPSLEFFVPEKIESDMIEWVKEHILKAKEKGSEIVFIDNLDFLRSPKDMRRPDLNMASYVGGIVQELKSFAVQNDMVVFLLVHIAKRNWASKELPTSEDIRDSGMIPQLADFVMFIKRDSDELESNYATLGIDKNRHNGRRIKCDLLYDEDTKMFSEVTGERMLEDSAKKTEKQRKLSFNKHER